MARYGQRPENALKRANEFIEVGKSSRALDTLQEVFRNKKWAYNWSESVLEPIMFKYLDLCVELKKSHIAKEGLFQYRNMFQSVNVGSLETVIRSYLRMAEERTENARLQSAQAVVDIDDLDNLATPESILLSAVSGEDAQDRSDRTILTPWVKFLWESYCQCLELLRTNAHVENLYHDIARMAFQFCLKYNRKTEFRKLCDKLRKHLEDICKLPAQVANVSISKLETQQLNLETRLYQLDSAIQMELWQEAYKAIEDIHGLMNMSKKMPVPKTMANYYQKLAMVFWKAGNYLFHAAALFKLFQLSKEMKKNITQEELQRMACRVLIATLSIPLPSAHPEFDRFIETDKSPLEKAQRLAVLLGLLQPPTRSSLLRDITRFNVINLAIPQLQDLYNWLEVDFNPLLLCGRVQNVIDSLENDEQLQLLQYIPALQDVTLVRLIRQIAQVYQTIAFSRLLELSKFATRFRMERLLVDCVRHNDMQISINHGKQCIHFGIDLSESQREDIPEGPTLQSMPSEQIRNQLVNMSIVLYQAMHVINPNKKKAEREKQRNAMVNNYHETKVHEHQLILQRHKIIEDRKEYIEHLNTVREEEEQRRLEEVQRQQVLAEQKRLEQERIERERKRALNEIQQIKDRHLKEKMQQISQTSHGQKILKKLDEDDIKKMDADQIAAREAEELQKERRELQAKLKSQEKKIDYLERAKRLEEIPLLVAHLKERELQDEAFWKQEEEERIRDAITERELAVGHQSRLLHMKPEKVIFLEKLLKDRNIVYEDKLKEFEKLLAGERRKRLAERRKLRIEERRNNYIREKQEEEELKRAEELRRQEEERQLLEEIERKEREEREKVEREERESRMREEQEKLERSAAKQRQKEEEIERRLQEEREAQRERTSTKEGASAWRSKNEGRSLETPKRGVGETDSWRKGGAPLEKAEEPKKAAEPWRPARLREAQSNSWRDDKDKERRDQGGRDRYSREDRDRYSREDRDRKDDRYGERGFDRYGGDKDRDRFRDGDRRDRKEYDSRDRKDYDSRDRKDYDSRDRKDYDSRDRKDYDSRDRKDYDSRDRKDYDSRDRKDYDNRDRKDYDSRDRKDYDNRDRKDYDSRDRKDYDSRDRKDYDSRDNVERKDNVERERRDDPERREDGRDRRREDRNRENGWRPSRGGDDDGRRGTTRSKETGDWRKDVGAKKDDAMPRRAEDRRGEKREESRPSTRSEKPREPQADSEDGWLQVRRGGR